MKIAAWNIQQGGGSRAEQIANQLLKHQLDIIILSEFRNNASGYYLRTKLLTKGYTFQYASSASQHTNSVLIASKPECNLSSFSHVINDFPEAIVCAEYQAFTLWGLYLPHQKKHRLFEFLLDQIQVNQRCHILMGDFNTGKNFIDQKGDSFWYTEHLDTLEILGFKDAFRSCHGIKKEYSWISH